MIAENTKYTLPEGWIWTTIGEIGIISSGGTPDRNNYNFFKGEIPWIKSGELNQGVIYKSEEHISEDALSNSSAKILPPKTLLIALYGATVGKLAILGISAATNQAIAGIISPTIDSLFLYYYFNKNRDKLLSQRKGGAQPNISQNVIREFPLPLPPLPEQQRIVTKIEELFSELDHAEEGLKKAQKQLKIYRQALLKSAFEGKLTEKWREENDYLKNNSWEHVTIKECSKFIGSGSTPKGGRSIYLSEGIPFIRSQNIHVNSFLQNDLVFISKEIDENMSRTKTQPYDVLLNITGASIGRSAYIPDKLPVGNVNQHVCIIRVSAEKVFYKYLTFYLNSPEAQIIINRINSGATREALTLSQIKDFVFPLCLLDEQYQIVQELESKFTLIENLEISINEGLQKTKVFRQAILKKAFEGKLMNQSQSDEPANKLLERILIEKKNYLGKYIQNSATKNKIMKKKTLPEILDENFVQKEFSFDEIKSKTFLSYEDLKNELYRLLDEGKYLETVFNEKIQKIQFKLKS